MSQVLRIATAALTLLLAAPAWASEGGGDMAHLVWMAVNLAILIGVLVYFGRRPIRAYFADRRHRIQHELKDAEDLRAEVESRLASWQRKLLDMDEEVERLRSLALEQAEAERDRILADANAAAERIRRDARAVIDQELRRSRDELREEAADLTVKLARDLLSRQVTDADRARLIDEFIESVEQAGGERSRIPAGAGPPGDGSGR